jgi:hypothetical protein
MKLDSLGLIEMEQTGAPGCYGDSCAESGRYVTLCMLLGGTSVPQINLDQLVTPAGVVRYPCPPAPWGPSDTSSDQVSPLIAALSCTQSGMLPTVLNQIALNGYKTGNGDLIEIGLYANMKRAQGSWCQSLWDMAILGQAVILALPIAWNPNAAMNPLTWIISSKNQTSGYLNWFNALAFARQKKWTLPCWLATKIISSKKTLKNVASYYQPEPNNSLILGLYTEGAKKIWK